MSEMDEKVEEPQGQAADRPPIPKKQLKKILEAHRKWVKSERKEGERANLVDANLQKANLGRANLQEADLRGADLSEANLQGANLSRAILRGADLSEADLRGADLSRANLQEADLRGADLSEADLFGAKLSGANLSGAILFGANLSGAIRISYPSLTLPSCYRLTAPVSPPTLRNYVGPGRAGRTFGSSGGRSLGPVP